MPPVTQNPAQSVTEKYQLTTSLPLTETVANSTFSDKYLTM